VSAHHEDAVRQALALADGPRAVERACAALRKAVADEVRKRPAEASLIAAHVAAQLFYLTRELPGYAPQRPRGCPRVPRPQDLLAAFEASLSGAGGEAA
jgi:hypothetical protein